MSTIEAVHVQSLFRSFRCHDLVALYAARDHRATLATGALDVRRPEPLRALQALLRACVAVALVNELPSAVFVESGLLWRAKVDASRRLHAAIGGPNHRDPLTGMSFDLLSYTVEEYEEVLLAAAALPPFLPDAAHHFAESLAAAREGAVEALVAWAERTTPPQLKGRLDLVLSHEPRPEPGPADIAPEDSSLEAAAVELRSDRPPSQAAVIKALYDLAKSVSSAATPGGAPYYQTVQPHTALDYLIGLDEIVRDVATPGEEGKRLLSYNAVIYSLAGAPLPSPARAPVAAVVRAARGEAGSSMLDAIVRAAALAPALGLRGREHAAPSAQP